MRYAYDFETDPHGSPASGLLRFEGLEWDAELGAMALTRLPGDPRIFTRWTGVVSVPNGPPGSAALDGSIDRAGNLTLYLASRNLGVDGLRQITVEADGHVSSCEPWPRQEWPLDFVPHDVAIGPDNLLALSDPDRSRVVLFDRETRTPRGEVGTGLERPSGLAWDRRGRLFFSCVGSVFRLDSPRTNLSGLTEIIPYDKGQLASPGPLTFDDEAQLIVSDGGRLRRFDADGQESFWGQEKLKSLDMPLHVADRIDWGFAESLGQVNAPSPKVIGLRWGQGRLWVLMAIEGDPDWPQPRLFVLNPKSLRLTAAPLHAWALAIAPTAGRRRCEGFTGRLITFESRGSSREIRAYDPRAGRTAWGRISAGPLSATGGPGRWRRLTLEGDGEWPSGVRSGLATMVRASSPTYNLTSLISKIPPPTPEWFLKSIPLQGRPEPAGAVQAKEWSEIETRSLLVPTHFVNSGTGSQFVPGRNQPPPTENIGPFPDAQDGAVHSEVGAWRTSPDDCRDLRLWHRPGPMNEDALPLWVVVFLRGDGTSTPRLRRLIVEADGEGWERMLPAIYGREKALGSGRTHVDSHAPVPVRLLDGLLDLFASALADQDARIDAMARWFDPAATPDPEGLARHLGMDPVEATPEQLRDTIASAWDDAPRLGTVRGLRRSLERQTEIPHVRIVEPGSRAGLWVLGATGDLGAATGLAAGPGVVSALDNAVLDQSRLEGEPGLATASLEAELWGEGPTALVARVFAADAEPERMVALAAGLDRVAPAHLMPVIQVIEPRMRLGYQATLGVDTVLARDGRGVRPFASPAPLDDSGSAIVGDSSNPAGSVPLRLGRHRALTTG